MKFFETFLSKETKAIRQEVINHSFWKQIENGTLNKKYLRIFILQDFWLVQQALKIDTLTIASMKSKQLQNLLLERLSKRSSSGFQTLFDFGEGIGATKKDFLRTIPLAGCMALTTYFYWMIDNTTDLRKIAAIDASKEVFSSLCVKIGPALKKHYKLSEKQIAFFTIHKGMEERLNPVEEYIKKNCKTTAEKKGVEQAIKLSYQHEILFYDTILNSEVDSMG